MTAFVYSLFLLMNTLFGVKFGQNKESKDQINQLGGDWSPEFPPVHPTLVQCIWPSFNAVTLLTPDYAVNSFYSSQFRKMSAQDVEMKVLKQNN